jgi:hypothetical protein
MKAVGGRGGREKRIALRREAGGLRRIVIVHTALEKNIYLFFSFS